ncbi:MAG: SusD/RagB family nutrient-binding outer membrane lipoprotein [Bacteroidia bacterium]|nr:SusD/RagB family nutrient-binding outer membrane lipoprotein [Bacteroidia bacterium]
MLTGNIGVDRRSMTRGWRAITSESAGFRQFFEPGKNNPRYEFDLNRAGNILMGDYFVQTLADNGDPREAQLNTINDGYWTSDASPVAFVTFAELKMIEAEALLMTGAALSEVKAALLEGSLASITEITGLSDADAGVATYLGNLDAAFDAATTDDERLGVIINEKYVITYSTGVDAWVDYRRTGYPDITPHPEGDRATNPGGAVPRRLPYPENERLLNLNIPFKEVNMQARMYWDE